MLWVCVVREIFNPRAAARAGSRLKPKAVVAAAAPLVKKPRLETSTGIIPLSASIVARP